MGGSFARTGLPNPIASATYDANNRLTNWNGTTVSQDANGNLLGFQGDTYNWNNRDQLASISGTNAASFTYDAVGRRQAKIIAGAATQFLYDGLNPIQERSGASVTASLLTGGLDEFYMRTEGANAQHYLTDALGSTVRLTDGTATKLVDYTYEPYGKTNADAVSTNAFQFTGRENDGTGLHYFRARYQHPVLGRFISEDPIGLAGGMNTYSYVGDNPVNFADPLGLIITTVDAFCLRDPETCAEVVGQIIQNESTIVQGCVTDQASRAVGAISDIVNIASAISGIGAIKGAISAATGIGAVAKVAKGAGKDCSREKQALVDMAQLDRRKGMTSADMQAYKDLNRGLPDPFPANLVRGPEAHANGGPYSKVPHGHVGPVHHIPIRD